MYPLKIDGTLAITELTASAKEQQQSSSSSPTRPGQSPITHNESSNDGAGALSALADSSSNAMHLVLPITTTTPTTTRASSPTPPTESSQQKQAPLQSSAPRVAGGMYTTYK